MYKIKLLVTINGKFSIYWGINYSLSQIISIYYSSWEINSFLQFFMDVFITVCYKSFYECQWKNFYFMISMRISSIISAARSMHYF